MTNKKSKGNRRSFDSLRFAQGDSVLLIWGEEQRQELIPFRE